jgi:pilus assembly protein CpaF
MLTPAPPSAVAVAGPVTANPLGPLRRALLEKFSARDDGGLSPESERARTERQVAREFAEMNVSLPDAERDGLFRLVMDELFGFGPIQPLLDDASVTEIMVNRADRVYAERGGKPARTAIVFDDDAHVRRIIDRIIKPLGRRLDANNPLVDARLPDGSRVNAVIPPIAIAGPCLTIRKFGKTRLGLDDLVRFGAMTPNVAEFLRACVVARLNIVVCGGTGSGKTTLLNCLSGCIPEDERIVTIEDAAELKLAQDHVITMESKRPNPDGTGEVTIRELVRNALRMRPERIVVGECRGAETLDMLQAMNTGHDGSLTSLHANSPRDAISRIETMALMGGIDFPLRVIREQIGSAVQVVIHQARMRDGSRRITNISEIVGLEGDKVVMQELFRYKEPPALPGQPADAKVAGVLQPSGLRPQFMPKIEACGIRLAPAVFMPVEFSPARRVA